MNKIGCAIGALWLLGCTDGGGDLKRVEPQVVFATEPASTVECPYGGTRVRSGPDENGNGTLDPAEVQAHSVVCNDPPVQPPAMIVVRLVAEPAGTNCALGGTAVQSGPDRNENHALDDDEVTHTDYVCGVALLTRLVAEPAGTNCPAGGVRILVGRDLDRDHQLGDDEVEDTRFSCGDVLRRDVVLSDQPAVDALASIAVIDGSLTLDGTAAGAVSLPRLVRVSGPVTISNNESLDHLSLAALQSVGGRFAIEGNRQLSAVDLPNLQRVGALSIARNAVLPTLRGMPALASVAGDLTIADNGGLTEADLPSIAIAGELAIIRDPLLTHTTWSLTAAPRAIHIGSNLLLESIEVTRAPGAPFLALGGVTIENNVVRTLSLAADSIAFADIHDNAALHELRLAFSWADGDVSLRDLGEQSSVSLESSTLFGRLIGGSLTISGGVQLLQLPSTLSVGGDVTIKGTEAAAFGSSTQTASIGGSLHLIDNAALVSLPTWEVGHDVEVRGNRALTSLGVVPDELFEFGGDVTITDNAALRELPAFDSIVRIHGNATVSSNPALKAAFSSWLERVDGDLTFEDNDSLAGLGLDNLVQVRSLAVRRCGALTELALPALSSVGRGIEVRGNAQVRRIRIPVLRRADMAVFDNSVLPACGVEALFAPLLGDHHQARNDDAAVCAASAGEKAP